MKIFSSDLTRQADNFTIVNEPVSSLNLMERAAGRAANKILKLYFNRINFSIFAGPGNNGGDGLVIARLLAEKGLNVRVYYVKFTDKISDDFKANYEKLQTINEVSIVILDSIKKFPKLKKNELIIDAVFGSGLTRILKGFPEEVVKQINNSGNEVVSIDSPSGLFGENNPVGERTIVKANHTLTFQYPSLSFMFAENEDYVGKFHVIDIGIHKEFREKTNSPYYFIQKEDVKIRKRKQFSHKGNYGHALLLAGSYGKAGACILAAKATHRTGTGLLTTVVPVCNYQILQIASPETMLNINETENYISDLPDLSNYNAVAVGPGIGFAQETKQMLNNLIETYNKPIVLDADALTILSENMDWLADVPENSIFTPHPKEFERLAGKSKNNFTEMQKQIEFAKKYKIFLILKGAYTTVATPEGKVFFNSTGNPGMATGGSGDVLTGIILSLLSQKYNPQEAAIYEVYIHGLAGDFAAEKKGQYPLIASDIIDCLPDALKASE
ncbi:MAG: NAD(P)H-hydrate dehydratase [Bacteroidales bacterium]|nr:NAD(P)H-hydrate dehydratase [Bacteroidales bacterium]